MTTREADNGELPMPTTESPSETNHSSAADTREQTPAAGFDGGDDMLRFFAAAHTLPFTGVCILW